MHPSLWPAHAAVAAFAADLVRVTLDGDQLGEFTAATEDSAPAAYSEGFDDVVFFCLPDPATGEVHLPVAAPGGGLAHPPGGAALVREYTVRSLRDGALCVDLVRHASGAGAHWLEGPARRRYPDRPARGLPAGADRIKFTGNWRLGGPL
ncbi:MAG: siderophore-interacting protein [Dietzia sp.]|uniref:siderophore-interacting protein n=1 Tax=Dietzia TaxID=37914 RepID=UPI0009D9ECC3|nr:MULTISPECIES: siderophore-interacting protein [Dietzia]MDO8393446.1 siderophore-interacting protein [Dietzia sp.]